MANRLLHAWRGVKLILVRGHSRVDGHFEDEFACTYMAPGFSKIELLHFFLQITPSIHDSTFVLKYAYLTYYPNENE